MVWFGSHFGIGPWSTTSCIYFRRPTAVSWAFCRRRFQPCQFPQPSKFCQSSADWGNGLLSSGRYYWCGSWHWSKIVGGWFYSWANGCSRGFTARKTNINWSHGTRKWFYYHDAWAIECSKVSPLLRLRCGGSAECSFWAQAFPKNIWRQVRCAF